MKKVMILTDLEGCCGTEGEPDHIGNRIWNGAQSVKCLVNEINACIDGLREGGADSILVWDCHGGGRNFCVDQLRPGVEVSMGLNNFCHFSFLDAGFCAAVQIGGHARQGVLDGYVNHTRNSHGTAEIALNGKPIGEMEFAILRAAFFKVPHILIAGDYAACRDALQFNGKPLETVVCKRAFSRYSVMHYPVEKVLAEIKAKSAKAMRNLEQYHAPEFGDELVMTYRGLCPNVMRGCILNGDEMLDETTVRLKGTDGLDLYCQLCGWAPGVHHRYFHITSESKDLF